MRFVGTYSKSNNTGALLIGALLVCAETSADDKWKYLTVNDPVPIRFMAATQEYDPANVLPPLEMGDDFEVEAVETIARPVEPAAIKEPEAQATEQTNSPQPKAPEVTANVPIETTPTPPATFPEARAEPSQMTPQMLLRYFNHNGTREVLVPSAVEFTPPAPQSGGRSSAVYSSPPAK
jgi:hypothetical protein